MIGHAAPCGSARRASMAVGDHTEVLGMQFGEGTVNIYLKQHGGCGRAREIDERDGRLEEIFLAVRRGVLCGGGGIFLPFLCGYPFKKNTTRWVTMLPILESVKVTGSQFPSKHNQTFSAKHT